MAEVTDEDAQRVANLSAFLHTLRILESNGNYGALYGGASFTDFRQHPSIKTPANPTPWTGVHTPYGWTHAAGAYQFEPGTWSIVQQRLHLPDFGEDSQNQAAVYLIRGRHAYDDVCMGCLEKAVPELKAEWQSLAIRPLATVEAYFKSFGGILYA